MNTTERIHQLVLALQGVSTLYPADPAWRTTMHHLGALLPLGSPAPEPTMVELHDQDSATTVRIRIGATGQVPAPELAVTVATAIRALLNSETTTPIGGISVQICSIAATPEAPTARNPQRTNQP